MSVLGEMAISAMHPFFKMDVLQMNGLAKFFRIVKADNIAFLVEQITVAVFFINGAENPAVAMKVCKLGVLKGFLKLGAAGFFQEVEVRPQTLLGRALRISGLHLQLLLRA